MSASALARTTFGLGAIVAATLACSTSAESARYPTGEVVVRDHCFDSPLRERKIKAPVLGSARTRSSAVAPAPPRSAPSPSPVADLAGGVAAAEPASAQREAEARPALDGMMEEAEEGPVERPDLDDDAAFGTLGDERRPQAPAGPALDWGSTVYLSNDDSMSLASAQRLLWAVEQGARWTADQVRPHELLNYFSFDTERVHSSEDFSVHAAAVRDGRDGLTMALTVKGASPAPRPLDLTLVLDRSGSMSSEGRMEYTKRGLRQMTDQLHEGDRLDVVLFDNSVCTPLENYVEGRDDPALLDRVIERMQPRGSTNLDAGLREAYRLATGRSERDAHGRNQRVMLITDALLNTGNVDEDLVSDVGRAFDEHGVRLTGIGVGRSFNDTMLDKLTEKGKGAYVYLGSEAVVDRVFGLGFPSLVQTIAHDVHFALHLPDSLAVERFYGEEMSTDKADVQPIHYYAGTSQVFLQDLAARGLRDSDRVELEISYREAATGEPANQRFRTTVGELLGAESRNVHKARALMAWSDMLSYEAMGAEACAEPLAAYRSALSTLGDDAELAYVSGLVERQCGVDLQRPATATVSYKVRVDSDIPIAEVDLSCPSGSWSASLSGSDSVARFEPSGAGACTLTLHGQVAMRTEVDVPATGGQTRCLVRGGRLSCS